MQIIFHFLFSIYFNFLIYTQLSTLSLPLHVLKYEVSSQENYDKVSFYKNGTELKINLSGTEYGSIELNGLIISDIIKVVYKKDSSTDSNKDIVSFSVGAVHETNNVRPVVSLKQNILITGGTGEIEDPYTVAFSD